MDPTNVQTEAPTDEPSPWAEIAAELRRIADDAEKLADQPAPGHFELNMQPHSPDNYLGVTVANRAATVAAVDAVAVAFLGAPAKTSKLSSGEFYHKAGGRRGRVGFSIYQSIADPDLIDKDEEIERLRSRVAELEAKDAHGYSREADDPTPVSPARVPLHTGGMTDGGLVDETSAAELGELADEAIRKVYGEPCQGAPAGFEADCGIPGPHGPHGLLPASES